jgi:pimeloyl-ACP methyl ester carboxylesterase
MADPARKPDRLRRISHAFSGLVLLIPLLAAFGAVYDSIEKRLNPPPGRLVDIGGFKLHLDCTGEGATTVLLESGLGDDRLVWYKVQPMISKLTRVCSYDRAGLGFSDPDPERPPDSRTIAQNLHVLLANAGVAPPYVMVGHSLGGIHVRVYQSLYPNEVVGLVLVDSAHPFQAKRLPRGGKRPRFHHPFESEFLDLASSLGFRRLTSSCGGVLPEIAAMQHTVECRWQAVKAREAEGRAFGASEDEGRQTGSLGSMPLVVLSRDPEKQVALGLDPAESSPRFQDQWAQLQGELAHLSTNGSRVVATGSTHYVQLDRPDLVVTAVQNILEATDPTPD